MVVVLTVKKSWKSCAFRGRIIGRVVCDGWAWPFKVPRTHCGYKWWDACTGRVWRGPGGV